jgi:hypothetical protein
VLLKLLRLCVVSLNRTLPLPVGPGNKAGQTLAAMGLSMEKGQDHISEYRNSGIAESFTLVYDSAKSRRSPESSQKNVNCPIWSGSWPFEGLGQWAPAFCGLFLGVAPKEGNS